MQVAIIAVVYCTKELSLRLPCISLSEAYDEFTILANSWRYSQQYSSELFFVKVDIDEDGMDAFQQVKGRGRDDEVMTSLMSDILIDAPYHCPHLFSLPFNWQAQVRG